MFASFFDAATKKKKEKLLQPAAAPRPVSAVKAQISNNPQTDKPVSDSTFSHGTTKGKPFSKGNEKNQHHDQKRKRAPVSTEALALSDQLKELSRQKRLQQALDLYWHNTNNNNITDAHHACILIDLCARCGSVDEAERVARNVPHSNIELQTALLKVYAHAGKMHKAQDLLEELLSTNLKHRPPNVRTLNTVLRGCLWTAASNDSNNSVAGGVVTSERAWKLFRETIGVEALDSSSYEYSITLLCQALNVDEAVVRLTEYQTRMNIRIKGKASFVGGDQTTLETLAVAYLSLARAYALQGNMEDMFVACQRVLNAVLGSRQKLAQGNDSAHVEYTGDKKKRQKTTTGGKQSWSTTSDARRLESNVSFRNHRLCELEMEARKLLKMRGNQPTALSPDVLLKRLLTRLFLFNGGGTTDASATVEATQILPNLKVAELQEQLLVPTMTSFGGSKLFPTEKKGVDYRSVCKRVGLNSKQAKCFHSDATLHFGHVFANKSEHVDIEIGSGFGEWIVDQAQRNISRNYVAVELRSDRVYQIFANATLELLHDNVCVVGSECGSFLRNHVQRSSVSTIFSNHPEPPTQTFGDDRAQVESIKNGAAEPVHMLNSETLLTAARCLKADGKIVIVTDNRWYARLLGATFVKVVRQEGNLLRSPKPSEVDDTAFRQTETFGSNVVLFEARRSDANGNSSAGVTWFDRLWKTGTGNHAERSLRFVLIMHRCEDGI
jgi:tRNA G46 methylase TrmB/tetratricopeptide (TPR) repeat protein